MKQLIFIIAFIIKLIVTTIILINGHSIHDNIINNIKESYNVIIFSLTKARETIPKLTRQKKIFLLDDISELKNKKQADSKRDK